MRLLKRWELADKFVHIEKGISGSEEVLIVDSNAFGKEQLPVEWRAQVAVSDKKAADQLIRSVAKWAESNGYQEVPIGPAAGAA